MIWADDREEAKSFAAMHNTGSIYCLIWYCEKENASSSQASMEHWIVVQYVLSTIQW